MHQQFRSLTGAVIFFLLLSPLDSVAQQNSDRLEPMDVFRVQVASDPQISPEGKHIVYVRQSADVASDPPFPPHLKATSGPTYLYVANRDGSNPHPVTSKLDRKLIAYTGFDDRYKPRLWEATTGVRSVLSATRK
jgi:hypothetical protein